MHQQPLGSKSEYVHQTQDPNNIDGQEQTKETPKKKFNVSTGCVLGDKFILLQKIGSGSFGTIYKIKELSSINVYAAKFEIIEDESDQVSLLTREIKILIDLKQLKGFPQIEYYGREENINFCIMNLLGENLENLMFKCGGKFSYITVSYLASHILSRIESLHNLGYLHRDIKPENFIIGAQEEYRIIYLIDFGLGKKYIDIAGKHIKMATNKGMIGTARYASVSSHQGNEQGRKDDLESIGYLLLYFLKGQLPWMNMKINQKEDKYKQIMELKKNISLEQLCEGAPDSFKEYFKIIRSYKFDSQPNYELLRNLFDKTNEDTLLDWEKLQEFVRIKRKKQKELSQIKSGLENNFESLQQITSMTQLQVPHGREGQERKNSVQTSKQINYIPSIDEVNDEKALPGMEQIINKNSILVKGVKKNPITILINASISYNMNSPTRKKQIKSLTTNPKFQKMDEIKQQGVSVHSDDDVGEENHEIGNQMTGILKIRFGKKN